MSAEVATDITLITGLVDKIVEAMSQGEKVTYQMAFLVLKTAELRVECAVESDPTALRKRSVNLMDAFG